MRTAIARVTALILVVVTLSALPAHAAVTVKFGISAGHYLPDGVACQVTVAQGASGVAVLNKAVDAECIDDYELEIFPGFGHFVRCITKVVEICAEGETVADATHYWAFYEDLGLYSPHGIDDFSAGNATHDRLFGNVPVNHTEFVLSLESFTKCLGFIANENWPLCNPNF